MWSQGVFEGGVSHIIDSVEKPSGFKAARYPDPGATKQCDYMGNKGHVAADPTWGNTVVMTQVNLEG
jgi:hypothetical protein